MDSFRWNENTWTDDTSNNDHYTAEKINCWLQANILQKRTFYSAFNTTTLAYHELKILLFMLIT